MAKRFGKGQDNDATQDVSLSQFVPPARPPSAPANNIPTERPVLSRSSAANNDMSVWGGLVIGTQDFAPPAPTKKPRSSGTIRWKWIAAGAGAVAAAIAAFLIVSNLGDDKPSTSASPAAAPVADQGAPDKAATDKLRTDKAASDKATPDKAATDKVAAAAAGSNAATGVGSNAAAANVAAAAGSSAAGSGADPTRAPTVGAVTGDVDAISGVAPIIKPVAKKKPVRKTAKKPARKKPAQKRR